MKVREKGKKSETPEIGPTNPPDGRYPEESFIDAMLESENDDDIPPASEEVLPSRTDFPQRGGPPH